MDNGGTNALAVELEETPAIESEATEIDAVEEEGPVSLDPDDEPEAETEEEAAADEEVEAESDEEAEGEEIETAVIEIDGQQYEVPKELEAGYMKNKDYTQKTQQLADERKQVDRLREQVEQSAQVSEAELNARADLISVDRQLKQFEAVDWDTLYDEDPIAAGKQFAKFQQLQGHRTQITDFLGRAGQERTHQTQQETAKRFEETRTYALKEIKGWSPDMDTAITKHAVDELGFSTDQLAQALNPQVYKLLHNSWQWSNAQTKAAAAKLKKAPGKTVKPLRTVSSKTNAPAHKDPADMSMDEYAKWSEKKFKDS